MVSRRCVERHDGVCWVIEIELEIAICELNEQGVWKGVMFWISFFLPFSFSI